jgi:hypothetical protein
MYTGKAFPPKPFSAFVTFQFFASHGSMEFFAKVFYVKYPKKKVLSILQKCRNLEEITISSKQESLDSFSISPNLFHIIMGAYAFVLVMLLFCVLPSILFGYTVVSLPILFFNVIFIFLVFPLDGPLLYKISLAAVGNMTGFGWEYFLSRLVADTCYYLGAASVAIYSIVNPFLELVWIVSMWALGLSTLASKRKQEKG